MLEAAWAWIREDWPVRAPALMTNAALDHQIATIEAVGLTRRFSYDREKGMYTSLVYS
ncbi:MAG: hypothetical protein AAF533_22055 [Acidobacteriota bacterium]